MVNQLQPATVTNKESLVIASIEQGLFSILRFLNFPLLYPFLFFGGNKKGVFFVFPCLFFYWVFIFIDPFVTGNR